LISFILQGRRRAHKALPVPFFLPVGLSSISPEPAVVLNRSPSGGFIPGFLSYRTGALALGSNRLFVGKG